MEIILAIVVASAVIFFGALISMGNERQRKAIDDLREQVVLWAMQDLRIKRESLARDVRVNDALAWLNRVASNASGYDQNLKIVEAFEDLSTIICATKDGAVKIIFSLLSPHDIRQENRVKAGRLSQYKHNNPLLTLLKSSKIFELSVLNSGILFDLELPIVWKELIGKDVIRKDRLWMYVISQS